MWHNVCKRDVSLVKIYISHIHSILTSKARPIGDKTISYQLRSPILGALKQNPSQFDSSSLFIFHVNSIFPLLKGRPRLTGAEVSAWQLRLMWGGGSRCRNLCSRNPRLGAWCFTRLTFCLFSTSMWQRTLSPSLLPCGSCMRSTPSSILSYFPFHRPVQQNFWSQWDGALNPRFVFPTN